MNKKLLLLSLVSVSLGAIKAEDVETMNQTMQSEMDQSQMNPNTQKSCRRCCWHTEMSPSLDEQDPVMPKERCHRHGHHNGMKKAHGQVCCRVCFLRNNYINRRKNNDNNDENQNNVMPMAPVVAANQATEEVAIAPETMQTDENQMVQDEDAEMQNNQMTPVVDVTEDVVEVPENVEVIPEVEEISVSEEPVDAAQ